MSNTRSSKSKGKRLQNSVTLKFRNIFDGILQSDDILSQIMGVSGTDIVLSPSAKQLIPYDIECKNVEKFISSIMSDALEQCEKNSSDGRIPMLIFKGNNQPERVILKFDDLLKLLYPNKNTLFSSNSLQEILIILEQLKQTIIKKTQKNT